MADPSDAPKRASYDFSYSARERLFCENIVNGASNVEAARQAGYADSSAGSQATRLLRKDKIQVFIEELREDRRVKAEIDSNRVTRELAAIAFSNVLELFDEDWQFKDRDEIRQNKTGLARAIRSVQVVEKKNSKGVLTERKITVRMHDKIRALDNLSNQLGLKMNDTQAMMALLKFGEIFRNGNGFNFEYDKDANA